MLKRLLTLLTVKTCSTPESLTMKKVPPSEGAVKFGSKGRFILAIIILNY
jgi:hypothetical protein